MYFLQNFIKIIVNIIIQDTVLFGNWKLLILEINNSIFVPNSQYLFIKFKYTIKDHTNYIISNYLNYLMSNTSTVDYFSLKINQRTAVAQGHKIAT